MLFKSKKKGASSGMCVGMKNEEVIVNTMITGEGRVVRVFVRSGEGALYVLGALELCC